MDRLELGHSRAHDIQGQGLPDSLSPVRRVSGVFPRALPTHGGQTNSPTRVRKPVSKEVSVGLRHLLLPAARGDAMPLEKAVAASMDMQLCLKLTIGGKTSFLWRKQAFRLPSQPFSSR